MIVLAELALAGSEHLAAQRYAKLHLLVDAPDKRLFRAPVHCCEHVPEAFAPGTLLSLRIPVLIEGGSNASDRTKRVADPGCR